MIVGRSVDVDGGAAIAGYDEEGVGELGQGVLGLREDLYNSGRQPSMPVLGRLLGTEATW